MDGFDRQRERIKSYFTADYLRRISTEGIKEERKKLKASMAEASLEKHGMTIRMEILRMQEIQDYKTLDVIDEVLKERGEDA